jgi:cell division protein FtsI/penicillin-binding protein 2
MRSKNTASFVILLVAFAVVAATLLPAAQPAGSDKSVKQKSAATQPSKKARSTASASVGKPTQKTTVAAAARTTTAPQRVAKRPVRTRYSPWSEPTYADSTIGDRLDGEDLTVRRAAVEALGRYNGSVVVADPNTGRVLSMVNQKVALSGAFQPCSTIKLSVAMAALVEGIIDRNTILRVAGKRLSLTDALAHSSNPFFASLGEKLGFARFSFYARLFGLGERAGLNIEGEQPGVFPSAPTNSGVGMMTSFGDGIALTPLQLASLLSALANGGTLYYLQYPRTNEELRDFAPKVRRRLDISHWLSDIRPGMMAAVEYGTARRANYDPNEPVFGKTGTCTDNRTHLGWFGSYNDLGRHKLVVVVLLTGGSGVGGSVAAQVAGDTYKRLAQADLFNPSGHLPPVARLATPSCCRL